MLYHTVLCKAFPFKNHPVEQIHSQDKASHTLFDKGMYFRIAVQWAKKEECRAIPPREFMCIVKVNDRPHRVIAQEGTCEEMQCFRNSRHKASWQLTMNCAQ